MFVIDAMILAQVTCDFFVLTIKNDDCRVYIVGVHKKAALYFFN